MKKLIFILSFAVGLISIKAQNFKYLDCSCEWRYFASGNLGPQNLITKYIDGDTLINGKVFFRVVYMYRFVDKNYFTGVSNYYPRNLNRYSLFYLSEDSLNNFIACSNIGGNISPPNMVYNFDSLNKVNIGDSFPKNTLYLPERCFAVDGYFKKCVVNKKDSFYLGSNLLIGYKSITPTNYSYTGIVEGVGCGNPYLCSWDGCPDGPIPILHIYKKQSDILKFVPDSISFPIDSFPIPIRTNSCTLPLKFVSFTTKLQSQNSIVLNWQTTNEINVSHFNIQRSYNNINFENIGKVNTKCCEYSFTNNQLSAFTGKLYYRLEIVDKDGTTTYSTIQSITINNLPLSINIYPNPAKDKVTIECTNVRELLVTDYLGRTIKKSIFNESSSQSNNQLSTVHYQLNKGVYIVKAILNNNEIQTKKLIVE